MKSALEYLEFAIAKCERDVLKKQKKQDYVLGLDLNSETLIDPKFKDRWDKYFNESEESRWKKYDKVTKELEELAHTLRTLQLSKFYFK